MKRIILVFVFLLLLVSCNSNATFNITYNLEGGVLEDAPSEYVGGEGIETLPVPTKEGYNFLGWYLNEEKVDNISGDMIEDIVLNAKWEKIKNLYSVKYNGYDNLNTSVYENETIVKPVDPIKEGYTFDGWYLNDELFDFNSVINENITLNAKFSLINYSITYNLEDGMFEGNVLTSYNVENYSELSVPSKDGYIFKYFIDAKGDVVESLENKFEDLNLTAIYEKIEKVVIFELGSYQVVKYFNKGTVIQNELFELIDGLIYDAKFDFNEFIVLDDVQIVAKEYIIYEIELQTKDNVLVSDYIEGHYIYKNVLENSDNVSVRPYISDEIIVDAIYGEIEFTDNLTTLLIKEGFENRTYTGSSNPNLIKLEYENGVTFVHNELCLTSPNLQILILPETIKLIGFFFYEYCINLETIYFRGESQINCQTGTSYAGGNLKIYFENWCPNGQKFYYNDSSQNELKEIPVYTYVSFDELFK